MYICLFIFIRPGAVCCPEVYRDVPGMMMMMMMTNMVMQKAEMSCLLVFLRPLN